MNFTRLTLLSVAVSLTLVGCANLAPEYSRPIAPVAETWPTKQVGDPESISVNELGWTEFYGDQRLRQLIELALNNNRSLRQDALAVESARAQFQIARANTLPTVDAAGSSTALYSDGDTTHAYSATLGISAFELDFFGRLKNLRDQALEAYLSYEE